MSDALNPSLGRSNVVPAESAWPAVARHAVVLVQLLLAIAVVQLYAIEGAKLEARKKGYSVSEQPLEGGSIRLQIVAAP